MNRFVKIFFAALFAITFSSSVAYAGTQAGDLEIGVSFAYDHMNMSSSYDDEDSTSVDSIVAGGNISYFVTDAISLGLTPFIMWDSPDDGGDTTSIFFEFQPDYHFNTNGTFVPYIGPHFGIMYQTWEGESETNFDYGGHVGVKAFVSEHTSVDVQWRYTRYDFNDEDVNDYRLQVGLNFYF